MTPPFPFSSRELSGQTALVTGASAGLGRHLAKVLASAGANVVVGARRADRLATLVDEIRQAGGSAEPLVQDMADMRSLPASLEAAERAFGLVTILVNNAGIVDAQLATKMPLDLIDQVIDTNLRGPFVLCREFAKRLIQEKQPGKIVNVASMSAFTYAERGASLYAVTKAALVRMTEVLAVEWAPMNINVNCIAPGAIESDMLEEMRGRVGDGFIQRFPRKRPVSPAGLETSLLYLVSPASEYVTGSVLKVDDGQFPR